VPQAGFAFSHSLRDCLLTLSSLSTHPHYHLSYHWADFHVDIGDFYENLFRSKSVEFLKNLAIPSPLLLNVLHKIRCKYYYKVLSISNVAVNEICHLGFKIRDDHVGLAAVLLIG
jgi:hypothetical protein